MADQAAKKQKTENGEERKRALLTGITGQDGSYLAELLLDKGYEVHGIIRRSSSFNTARIDHLYRDRHETGVRLFLHYGDLSDSTNLFHIISTVKPHEVYNLGAMSHVAVSGEDALNLIAMLTNITVPLCNYFAIILHTYQYMNGLGIIRDV